MTPLADIGAALSGFAVLLTAIAGLTVAVMNARRGPSEKQVAEAEAKAKDDAFYRGRLDRSEADLADEEKRRREAEEMLAMRDAQILALRRAKDDDEHSARMEARECRERVARLVEQVEALGAAPVD